MSFKADLHCHSTCSDGTMTPAELVAYAKECGLQGLSITDHDSVAAYQKLPVLHDFLVGTGVEFSAQHKQQSIHILGYDIDPNHKVLLEFCEKHKARRFKRNKAILGQLALLGLPIEENMLFHMSQGVIGRPHIAKCMVEKGYVESFAEAFQKYLAEGKCAYVQEAGMSIEETLHVIHAAGGKAFLAHPHLIVLKKTRKNLLEFPFDGIEAYYGRFPKEVQEYWVKVAKERNLLISGGSDFHGSVKKESVLGSCWVSEEQFHLIFQKHLCS